MKATTIFILLFLNTALSLAQSPDLRESGLNNLIHTEGYNPGKYGAIPEYIKTGTGKRNLILIPGMGFDASVFEDFMVSNKKIYTMYVMTIAGYGNTNAPPMPPAGTSYGEQSWNKSVVEGIAKLINKEKIDKPVIVGHFVQGTSLALRLAINYPEKIKGVVILGGGAKFISQMNGKTYDLPIDKMISATDSYMAPVWFKSMKKEFFDANNFLPEVYSIDKTVGQKLWEQVKNVQMAVAVRYSCEYFASDVKAEFEKIKCPVLVLRATFNENILNNKANAYLKPQFIDSWNNLTNSLFQITDVPNASCFVWKDNPKFVDGKIQEFLKGVL